MSADLAGFVGGLLLLRLLLLLRRSDTCGEGGRVSSELSESSDEIGPSLTSMAVAASAHTLQVASIRELTALFIVGLD